MNRYKVTKIGLLNFWLYDEEEYDFYGGKLILRGTNGSGKSVTMQSFIPLILDGNKSPDRLDPFGSKERKIEDYIIGDSESIQREEATSYLYMECYREDDDKYITIGLGFRGRKGKPVESWGFSLKDGKRIGKDFFLYKDKNNKIPLTKNELKSRLGNINEFTDTTRDYKAMVNRLLFGFPNLDTYDEFIKLLLQLRSNKLSKDYKPTNLINVLNTVLQPLTEEDLRPLSEAIEQMNKTKEQVETLEKNSKYIKEFLKAYNNYNEILLINKARNYDKVNTNYKQILSNLQELDNNISEVKQELENNELRYNKVLEEIEINTKAKQELDNNDLKQKIETLSNIKETIKSLQIKIKELSSTIDNQEQEKINLNKKISNIEDEIYTLEKSIKETSNDLKDLSNESYFDELVFFIDELLETLNNKISYESIFMSIKRYQDKINKVISLLEEEEKNTLASQSIRLELEKLKTSYKELEININNQEKLLKESIMTWQEDFIKIENNNKYLKIPDNIKKEIFTLTNDYSNENYNKAKTLYQNTASNIINEIKAKNLKLDNKLDNYKEELNTLEKEYITLKRKEDLEIESINVNTDNVLKDNNIDYIQLYKCIEFKPNIKDKIKNNIESSLLDLNILNAHIIKESDIPKVKKLDKQIIYLTKTTRKKNNILQYFDIKLENNTTIKENYIKEILESISIDDIDSVSISEYGTSKLDFINSITNKEYKQTYIGFLKRKELKEKKLKELNNKIDSINKEITNISNIKEENNKKIEILNIEINNLPSNETITNIEDKIKELNLSLTWNDKQQKELEEEISKVDKYLNEIKNNISEETKGIYIPKNLTSYKEVSNLMISIKESLQEMKVSHNSYLNKIEINNSYKLMLNNLIENLDYLTIEYQEKNKNLNINIKNKETIESLLETKEYKDIKEKLLRIEDNLISLSSEKDTLLTNIATLKKDNQYQEEKLNILNNDKQNIEKELDTYKHIFLREYKLNYIYEEEIQNIDNMIKKIIKEGSNKKDLSPQESLKRFYDSYNQYKLELNDYSLKTITLFDDYNIEDEVLKEIYKENTRVDISCMYQGIKLNIIELSKKIESDIEENKDLISTQDRHLFEDILLNTVGSKIRDRIASSNEWVSKINNIMSQMQENSALSFKLVWKSISAENEDELDTKELVRILKMDPKLLKDSDSNKLTNHFRSKIKKAEDLYQDSYISFYKIIEEILDYRSWFTFQLLYQRKGMPSKELTDKTFSKFSGGERAKSMYIPLFASVYAKYYSASKDALRIIALDEAFAGVDEDNIREMFGILKYLDIDFIINSQVLWGDYDTIEDLSICELIRPQNSQVVTVERYRWNGKYKEIITNREDNNIKEGIFNA